MKSGYKILAIIPARGGSKGVPRKNIKPLCGKPLIAWTIETAISVPFFDRIVVSTDDEEIALIAKEHGAEVPFLRPSNIAEDDSTDFPVYEHALSWLEKNENFVPDVIVWLRPTSPLRNAEDIGQAIELLIKTKEADWVRSLCTAEHHPYWMYRFDNGKIEPFIEGIKIEDFIRRQLLPPAYRLNGAVEVAWRSTIVEKKLLYAGTIAGYVMPVERSVDVDTLMDFKLLESILSKS